MTTNLRRGDDGFVWRFDLDIVETLLDDYRDQTYWSYLDQVVALCPPYGYWLGVQIGGKVILTNA